VVIIAVGFAVFTIHPVDQLPSFDRRLLEQIQDIRRLSSSGDWPGLVDALEASHIAIPAGAFLRGSHDYNWDERPEQPVYLNAFSIDQFEVTNVQYRKFLSATGGEPPVYWSNNEYPANQADYPVTGVTWEQANQYCQWAGERLPTEAEWEKACRGTDGRLYPWGNNWKGKNANLDPLAGSFIASLPEAGTSLWDSAWKLLKTNPENSASRGLRPIGSYPEGASPYGVLDLAGNVSEWVADWYVFKDYHDLPDQNPFQGGPEWNHGLRGSSWYDPNGSQAWEKEQSRCSARNSSHDRIDPRVGFRCALSTP